MVARKQFQSEIEATPELLRLLAAAKDAHVTEEELHEQRISFAFGNAPLSRQGRGVRLVVTSSRWTKGVGFAGVDPRN